MVTGFVCLFKSLEKNRLRWRRGSESNRRMQLLQSRALPLGYPATRSTLPLVHIPSQATENQGFHSDRQAGRDRRNAMVRLLLRCHKSRGHKEAHQAQASRESLVHSLPLCGHTSYRSAVVQREFLHSNRVEGQRHQEMPGPFIFGPGFQSPSTEHLAAALSVLYEQ